MANEDGAIRTEENGSEQSEEPRSKIQDGELEVKIQNEEPEVKTQNEEPEVKIQNEDEKTQTEEPEKIQTEEPKAKPNEEPDVNSPTQTDELDQNSLPDKQKQPSNKITVIFQNVGGAPIVKPKKWTMDSSKNIGTAVYVRLRKLLKLKSDESLCLYINQFSPPLDTMLSTLFECYGTEGALMIHYSTIQAYG